MLTIEQVFKAYYLRLHSFALHWVRTEEVAKDIVQDAFLNLVEQHAILSKPELLIKSYLYSTVKNLCLNHIRNSQNRNRINSIIAWDEMDDVDLMDNLIRSEVLGELYQELALLPQGCQHICRLIYFEGKKYEEVALELGVSINTVKSQRQRALRLLKNRLFDAMFLLFLIKLFIR